MLARPENWESKGAARSRQKLTSCKAQTQALSCFCSCENWKTDGAKGRQPTFRHFLLEHAAVQAHMAPSPLCDTLFHLKMSILARQLGCDTRPSKGLFGRALRPSGSRLARCRRIPAFVLSYRRDQQQKDRPSLQTEVEALEPQQGEEAPSGDLTRASAEDLRRWELRQGGVGWGRCAIHHPMRLNGRRRCPAPCPTLLFPPLLQVRAAASVGQCGAAGGDPASGGVAASGFGDGHGGSGRAGLASGRAGAGAGRLPGGAAPAEPGPLPPPGAGGRAALAHDGPQRQHQQRQLARQRGRQWQHACLARHAARRCGGSAVSSAHQRVPCHPQLLHAAPRLHLLQQAEQRARPRRRRLHHLAAHHSAVGEIALAGR